MRKVTVGRPYSRGVPQDSRWFTPIQRVLNAAYPPLQTARAARWREVAEAAAARRGAPNDARRAGNVSEARGGDALHHAPPLLLRCTSVRVKTEDADARSPTRAARQTARCRVPRRSTVAAYDTQLHRHKETHRRTDRLRQEDAPAHANSHACSHAQGARARDTVHTPVHARAHLHTRTHAHTETRDTVTPPPHRDLGSDQPSRCQ